MFYTDNSKDEVVRSVYRDRVVGRSTWSPLSWGVPLLPPAVHTQRRAPSDRPHVENILKMCLKGVRQGRLRHNLLLIGGFQISTPPSAPSYLLLPPLVDCKRFAEVDKTSLRDNGGFVSRSCAHCRPREPKENTLFLFETRLFTRSEQSSEAGVI